MNQQQKRADALTLGLYAIKSHKVVNDGISTPDYYQGASIYRFKTAKNDYFDEVFTGIGATVAEAYNDALNMAAEQFDTACLPQHPKGLNGESVAQYMQRQGFTDDGETYCYVLLYVEILN